MRRKTPYLLVIRYYGLRLLAVSAVWFLYDVSLDLIWVPYPLNLNLYMLIFSVFFF